MQVPFKEVLDNGFELLKKGDTEKSYQIFNHLFNETLHHSNQDNKCIVLFQIGSVAMKRGHHALAILLFKESLKYRPDFLEGINNLGYCLKKEQLIEEAKEQFEKTLKLMEDPAQKVPEEEKAGYFTNFGSLFLSRGTPLKAIEYFDKALKIKEDEPMAKWNRSLAYLELGNYAEGFAEYEFGERKACTQNRHYGKESLPFWDGTSGQTVIVYGEQGIGDEIMFASMLPDLIRDCTVILEAHPRLADLFRLNFNIPVYGTRKSEYQPWAQFHKKVDAKVLLGSLGKFYRKKEEDFPKTPYLKAHPELIQKYREKLTHMSDRPKIGVSWMGGTLETGKLHRHIKLELWKEILALPADFISLQYTRGIDDEVKFFEKQNKVCLNHWQDVLDDYDETAGLISNLDLIISVPQSVVHLAGALGVMTWQLCPKRAMWQMGPYGKNMPWYSTVENIWQDESCQWEPVMKIVKDRLCALLPTTIAA